MKHNKKPLIPAKLVTLNAYSAKHMRQISSKLFKSTIVRASLILACWGAMSERAFALIDGYTYNTTNIYKVNLSTGALTSVYTFNPALSAGAAIAQRSSDGIIFFIEGQSGNDRVYSWDPNTLTVAPVSLGLTGTPATSGYLPRLAFSPNGTLYGINTGSTILYRINQTTGAATQVGTLTGAVSGGGDMAFAPDGTLYMMVGTTLYRVPLTGGAVTSLGTITNIAAGTTITGLAFDVNGRLVGSNSTAGAARLYEIPLAGGAAIQRGTASTITMGDLASLVAPEFIITKTHTGNFTQGQTGATYTLTVKNDGNLSSTGVTTTVTDTVPTGLTPTAASGTGWTCNISGQIVTCTRTDALAPAVSFPSITLTVDVASNAPTSITNTAAVANSTDPITTNNTASDTTTINLAPDLTIAKSHTGNFNKGQTGTYTIAATNSGTTATSGTVTISATVPTGLTPTNASGTGWLCNISGQVVTCTRSDALAINTSYPPITLTVNVASTVPTSVTNTATVSGGGQFNTANDSASDATTIDPSADLSLTKIVNNASPNVGDSVTFTVTLNNAGPDAATGVDVTDLLPAGLTFVSATPSQGTYSNTTGVWTVGTVASGTSTTLQIVATVATAGAKTNTAQISASAQRDPDSTPNNNVTTEDDQASVTVTPPVADLSLTKTTSNPTPSVGANVNFTVTLNNAGPNPATGVSVTDLLPTGLTFVSANPSQGTYNSSTGVWAVGTVANSANATLQIVATVATAGAKTNTAQVSASNQSDPDSTPNNSVATEDDQASVTVTPPATDLSITKTDSPDPVIAGANLTYAIAVTNSGPTTATNVTMSDPLPSGTTFQSITAPSGWTCTTPTVGTNGTVSCTNPSLATGSASFTLVVRVSPTAANNSTLSNTATVSSTTSDTNPTNNSSSQSTTVRQSADLRLIKASTPASPAVGSNFDYTITVTNDGASTATNVQVTDQLPPTTQVAVTSVGITTTQGTTTYNAATPNVVWNVGTLAPNTSATLTIPATRVTAANTVNTAEITFSDQLDPDSTPGNGQVGEDDRDSVTVPSQSVDLGVAKTVNNATPNVGNDVTFTITVTNPLASGTTATNIGLSDVLPPGLTYQSNTASSGTYNSGTGIWSIASLSSGTTATLTITARVTTSGAKTNTALLTALDQSDPNSSNDTSSAIVTPTSVPPNLLLVKRITAINGVDVTGFQDGVNTPGNPNNVGTKAPDDNDVLWPSPNTTSLRGAIHSSTIAPTVSFKPGDEVEYTIYFLNKGASQATNVSICDFVPANQTYISTGYNSLPISPDSGGVGGTNYGIVIQSANSAALVKATNASDGDRAQLYTSGFPGACKGTNNSRGAVVVNMGTIPNATAAGTPANSYGFIRFKAKID